MLDCKKQTGQGSRKPQPSNVIQLKPVSGFSLKVFVKDLIRLRVPSLQALLYVAIGFQGEGNLCRHQNEEGLLSAAELSPSW